MSRTLYEILEIPEGATSAGIKDAYRRLAMKWHPDRNPDNLAEATERFKQISYAYKVLFDPAERANYDESLREQRQHQTGQSAEAEQEGYEDFSGAAAQQMFFEQMLDLAVELAARGFGQDQIIKTLLSLDCPEAIARAAAANALKTAGKRTAGNTHRAGSQRQQVTSVDQLDWSEAEPFYAAVVGGTHAANRMENGAFEKRMKVFKRQDRWILVSLLVLVIGAIGTAIAVGAPDGTSLAVPVAQALIWLGGIGLLVAIILRVVTDSSLFRHERTIRYYLTAFECFHNAKPIPVRSHIFHIPAFFTSLGWLAYRRMPGYALLAIMAFASVGSIAMFVELDDPQLGLAFNAVSYGIAGLVGVIANKTYFRNTRKHIQKFITLPRDRSLAKLREVGGTNSWSWVAFFVLLFVLLIPAAAITGDIAQERAAVVEAQEQAVEQAESGEERQASVQNDAEAMEPRSFDLAVAELEARHPELDPKHPRYDQALVDEAITRMEPYLRQGNTRSNALRLAVADMEREADTAPTPTESKRYVPKSPIDSKAQLSDAERQSCLDLLPPEQQVRCFQ